jgi:hypothetical protein
MMNMEHEPQVLYSDEKLTVRTPSDKVEHYEEDGKDIYEDGNSRLEIMQDTDPTDPREWDNLGIMIAKHRNYSLGDTKEADEIPSDIESLQELRDYLKKEKGATVLLPLILYDHSGISMHVGSRGDIVGDEAGWDTSPLGFIYTTDARIKEAYDVKKVTPATREKAEKSLRGEVETYNQYLTGDVYGYDYEAPNGEGDSTWGYYGSDIYKNGIYDSLPEDARRLIKKAQEKNREMAEA